MTGPATARKRTLRSHPCDRKSTESPRPVRGTTKLVHDYLDPEHFVVAVAGFGHRMNRLSGDFSPLHTDDEWVRKNTPFSSRIALAP